MPDNVNFIDLPSPTFGPEYYHGEVPKPPEYHDLTSEDARTAAHVLDYPTAGGFPASDNPTVESPGTMAPSDPDERHSGDGEDPYESLSRNEMRDALEEHSIEHDLPGNASRAKYLEVYRQHFEPPTE